VLFLQNDGFSPNTKMEVAAKCWILPGFSLNFGMAARLL